MLILELQVVCLVDLEVVIGHSTPSCVHLTFDGDGSLEFSLRFLKLVFFIVTSWLQLVKRRKIGRN